MTMTEMIAEDMWKKIEPMIKKINEERESRKKKKVKRRSDEKKVFTGIIYVLRTGIQWTEIPRIYGSKSTIHRYFQEWSKLGVFTDAWKKGLKEYEEKVGIDWKWQAADGAMTKAPLGGEETGKNPTDRAKIGTKRSLLVDSKGIPLAIVVSGANTNDHLLLEQTLLNIQAKPSIWIQLLTLLGIFRKHICLDKAYDNEPSYKTLASFGYSEHVAKKGQNPKDLLKKPGQKPRRWVVEVAHSWINRFRKLLVRFEKSQQSYLAFLHLACSIICFRKARLLG